MQFKASTDEYAVSKGKENYLLLSNVSENNDI